MKIYFYVAVNGSGLKKSGLVRSIDAEKAFKLATDSVTTYSDDKYVVIKFEVVE